MPRNDKEHTIINPRYFELLTEDEKNEYSKLREQLSSPNYKNRRNKSNEVFRDMVDSIKQFSIRNDENDWKRSLVCGIIWLSHSIAINTHQLRLLITKCKSSINGSFQALGYGTIPTVADSASELITKFPFLRHNFSELRQWTVRQKIDTASTSSLDVPTVKKETRTNIAINLKNDATPPPDLIEILPENPNEREIFSLSLPAPPLLDFLAEDSLASSSASSLISDYLNIGLNLEEKEPFLKQSSIDDYDIILPKPTQSFENDPLIFFQTINF